MKVNIEYSAMLDVKGHENGADFECQDGTTISDILTHLQIRKEHKRFVVATIDNVEKRHSYVLQDGDKLFLLVLASGG